MEFKKAITLFANFTKLNVERKFYLLDKEFQLDNIDECFAFFNIINFVKNYDYFFNWIKRKSNHWTDKDPKKRQHYKEFLSELIEHFYFKHETNSVVLHCDPYENIESIGNYFVAPDFEETMKEWKDCRTFLGRDIEKLIYSFMPVFLDSFIPDYLLLPCSQDLKDYDAKNCALMLFKVNKENAKHRITVGTMWFLMLHKYFLDKTYSLNGVSTNLNRFYLSLQTNNLIVDGQMIVLSDKRRFNDKSTMDFLSILLFCSEKHIEFIRIVEELIPKIRQLNQSQIFKRQTTYFHPLQRDLANGFQDYGELDSYFALAKNCDRDDIKEIKEAISELPGGIPNDIINLIIGYTQRGIDDFMLDTQISDIASDGSYVV
ncbi:hypothetical protein RFI_24909 [Reticulomyxa filosa]|uniref:Uncharacterized protein n=1 Tax=Reticulomyxa filosa TaxID=46433 RepID=X6MHD3_RETFI|nr:hypothetical protein RFI_24909 [Reticulomyxa filosa]|eukprot:ETO12465.1 hypothetical protein RFI_24909 [Reticulomyxa filosa]